MLVVFPPIFVADTKIIYGYNLVASLISKFMTSQPGQQTATIHLLPNISRSKDNQAMKFDQIIEDTKKNIFLEKSYRN